MATRRTRTFRPGLFPSPIDLPERRVGSLQVRYRTVKGSTPIISLRQSFTRGVRAMHADLDKPLRVHELVSDADGVWMTDLPEELNQIAEVLHRMPPRGHVLVGGLGLGILPAMIANRRVVDSVTVVELSPDVGALTARPGYSVVYTDIAEYLRTCPRYDYWYLDTWQGQNEGCWWDTVMPLRRIIGNRFGRQQVWCWSEDIMLGQVFRSALMQSGQCWYYTALPEGIEPDAVRRLVRDVGLPSWEREFGVAIDAYVAEQAEKRRNRKPSPTPGAAE